MGVVKSLLPFGAFVELKLEGVEGVQGLLHVSEISEGACNFQAHCYIIFIATHLYPLRAFNFFIRACNILWSLDERECVEGWGEEFNCCVASLTWGVNVDRAHPRPFLSAF